MSDTHSTILQLDYSPNGSTPSPSLSPIAGGVMLLVLGLLMGRKLEAWQQSHNDPGTIAAAPKTQTQNQSFTQPTQWIVYGKELEKKDEFAAAVDIYEQGLVHYPNNVRLWHEKGLALAKLQRFEAALDSYDRAYALNPKERELAHERGDTLLQLERYEEAIASFDIYLRFDPKNTHIWADRGYALYYLNRHEEAVQSFEHVFSDKSEDPNSYTYRHSYYYQIYALCHLDRLEEAFTTAKLAAQRYSSDQTFNFVELLENVRQGIAEALIEDEQQLNPSIV
jgi:tetratricopeptide (TPR) repeat protein